MFDEIGQPIVKMTVEARGAEITQAAARTIWELDALFWGHVAGIDLAQQTAESCREVHRDDLVIVLRNRPAQWDDQLVAARRL